MEELIKKIVEKISLCSGIYGIVLGGSRATGSYTACSDIDIGIYYEKESLDLKRLNEIAKKLDDKHRDNLVCEERCWGNWVNCGGWLEIDGYPVDLILRDIKRVEDIVENTNHGKFSNHYQTGHPHAYIDVMYRGELATCQMLYGNEYLKTLKEKAEVYPQKLKESLLEFFMFEANFSYLLAEKYGSNKDIYYLSGHLFRSVSCLNQVLFALNEKYCLNEKKAVSRIDGFEIKPKDYQKRITEIFENYDLELLKQLLVEVEELTNEFSRKNEK